MSESSVAVTINGRKFTFALGPEQSADQIRQAAQLLDEKMRQAKENNGAQAPLQTAILASMNLVDELLKLQIEYESAESDIELRTSRLSASINRVFAAIETVEPNTG